MHISSHRFLPILICICIAVLLSIIIHEVQGDAPNNVELEYDFDTEILNVTITHSVGDPEDHYINRVEITKNSIDQGTHTYTSQPDDYPFTYSYSITADHGDILEAIAKCNKGGQNSDTLEVDHPDEPMNVWVLPSPAAVMENASLELTISVDSDGDPVINVNLTSQWDQGIMEDISDLGGGDYRVTYTAPNVSNDTSAMIKFTASKRGYITTYLQLNFTIVDVPGNATSILIREFPILNETTLVEEGTSFDLTLFLDAGGVPLSNGSITITGTYGDLTEFQEVSSGDYQCTYTAPSEIDQERIIETLVITVSRQGHITSGRSLSFTIIQHETTGESICISLEPGPGELEAGSVVNFTISLVAGCGHVEGSEVSVSHLLGAVSNVVELGKGEYSFTYFAPTYLSGGGNGGNNGSKGDEEHIECFTIIAIKDEYIPAQKDFQFTIIQPKDTGNLDHDGIIGEGEYEHQASFGGGNFKVHWRFHGENISMALEGRTTGWISIGFDPGKAMANSDMIFGYVDNDGVVHIEDAYSVGPTGPHPPDIEEGGSYDILSYGGSEEGGITIIEFTRKLSTGDSKDKDIPREGSLDIIWSNGPTDDFYQIHDRSQVGAGTIVMNTGESTEEDDIDWWPVHAIFMTIGIICMFAAVYIVRYRRKEKWWLKYHKYLGLTGSIFTIPGILVGYYMVEEATGEHIRVSHAVIGILAILFTILAPTFGLLMFKLSKHAKKVKVTHRWIGRITVILMIITVISGLREAGVI